VRPADPQPSWRSIFSQSNHRPPHVGSGLIMTNQAGFEGLRRGSWPERSHPDNVSKGGQRQPVGSLTVQRRAHALLLVAGLPD
jgi:hypothetical protein